MVDEYRESDLKYIAAIATHPDPVVTANEVADSVDVTQQAAHTKLTRLNELGFARKKKVGSRAVIWWLTSDGIDVYKAEFN